MPPTNTELAQHIALALASDTHTVLELRKLPNGTYQPVLDPEQVAGTVLRILETEAP